MIDLRSGIMQTAASLGMPPEDLATIISYESGFRPDVWGGSGGNYYGLIQFGPRERAQYGVRVGDPSSQLGPNGAIANYFRDRGYRQGMGLLDAYSIVNAGSPGRYNASDAANGGAPGTIYQKVTQQMGPHRKRAAELLGGSYTPDSTPSPQPTPGAAGSSPSISPYALAATRRQATPKERFGSALADAVGSFGGGGNVEQLRPQPNPTPEAARVDAPVMPIFDTQRAEANRQQLVQIMTMLNQNKVA